MVEPAGEHGLAEAVADKLFWLGDADIDGPLLGADAGQPIIPVGRPARKAHLAASMSGLALTAAIWHNDKTGQPVMRSLIAYDH